MSSLLKAPTGAWWRLPPALSGTAACFIKMSYNICRSFRFIAMGSLHGNRCEEEALPSELSLNLRCMAPRCRGWSCGPIISAPIRLMPLFVVAPYAPDPRRPTVLSQGRSCPSACLGASIPARVCSALHVCPGASRASRGSLEAYRSECCPSPGCL